MISKNIKDVLNKRIAFENALNQFKYRDEVPIGALCSYSINRWTRNHNVISRTLFIRNLLFFFSKTLKKIKIKMSMRLYLLPNQEARTLRIFEPIKQSEDDHNSQFLTINKFQDGASFFVFITSLFYTLWTLKTFTDVLKKAISQTFVGHNKSSTPLVLIYILQCIQYDMAKSILKKNKTVSILVDLDRSYFGAPIILAAQYLKIHNATLVYGSVFPPYLFVPVIADKIYCWGTIHTQLFSEFSNKKTEYIITGSIASAKKEPKQHAVVKNKITFISQNFTDTQYIVIDKLGTITQQLANANIEIYVKAHPADDYKKLKNACLKNNLKLFGENITLDQCVHETYVFLVISSTFVFDALGYNIPVIFFNTETGQEDLAYLFKNKGNAIVVHDEIEFLKTVTDKTLTANRFNLADMRKFYLQYIDDFGVDAAKNLVDNIKMNT